MALRPREKIAGIGYRRSAWGLPTTCRRAVLGGAALILGLLGSIGAHAQCTGPSPDVAALAGELLPLGRGGTVGALVSVIDTANTAFLAGTSAFVGSPPSPTANQQGGGAWGRAIVGTVDNDSTTTTDLEVLGVSVPGVIECDTTVEQDFAGFQVGRDIARLNFDGSGLNVHFGLTAGYFEADSRDVSPANLPINPVGTFEGNFKVPFAGLYGVLTKGNLFADGLVRWDFFDNEVSDSENGLFAQKFAARSLSVTGNLGYRFDVPVKNGSKWFIEPSVGGVWSRTEVDPLNVSGTFLPAILGGPPGFAFPGTVQINDVESKLARASLRVGTSFTSGKVAWQPFATASVFHEFGDDVTTTQRANSAAVCATLDVLFPGACDVEFDPANSPGVTIRNIGLGGDLTTSRVGTYGQFGLGITGQLIDTGWLGYARVDYRTGDNIEGVSGNIGLRYQFLPDGALAHSSLKDGSSPDAPGPYNWTGLYVGGSAGATWGDEDWQLVANPAILIEPDFQGYLLGGQVGYNHQVGVWVLGVEGDIGTSNAEGGKSCPNAFIFTCEAEVDNLASVTGRLGYAWERALMYVKGGVAFGEVTVATSTNGGIPPVFDASTSKWQTGWTVGTGVEFALSQNWSAKGEWMYFDLGSERYQASTSVDGLVDVETSGEVARVGINYHFGR